MTDYMPVLIDTRNVWQRSYETEVGTVVQNDHEFIRKEYITDYTSIANRDIMVYEEGSYIQRYVYGLNGERTSAEFSYYPETERTADLSNPGENPASDFAAVDIQKIYYFRNLLDSTMLAMDRNGDVISHVMYDEWGTPLTEPRLDHNFAGIKNINNYTGYTYDYILDIYFAQNRFYNPDTRQFIQQDPIKDGMNFYQYVEGNPLVNIDPYGTFVVGVGLGARAAAGIGALAEISLYFDGHGDVMLAWTVGLQYQVNISANLYLVVYYSPTMNSVDDVLGISGGLYISYSAGLLWSFAVGANFSHNNANLSITGTRVGTPNSILPVTYSQQLVVTTKIIKFNLRGLLSGNGMSTSGIATSVIGTLASYGVFATYAGVNAVTFQSGSKKVTVTGVEKNLYFLYKAGCQ